MSNNSLQVSAVARADKGKGASRRLRHANKVPAILYGAGQDPVSICLEQNEIMHNLENDAFYSSVLSLTVDGGESVSVVLKDLQRHPYKAMIMHADFLRLADDAAIQVIVPLHFVNASMAPGVKLGATFSFQMRNLKVECLPKDLPESIEFDLSVMNVGDLAHLSDIKLPEGVELTVLKYGAKFDAPVAQLAQGKGQ